MILKCAVSEYSSISASINHIPLCYMTQHVAFIAFTQPVSLQKKKTYNSYMVRKMEDASYEG